MVHIAHVITYILPDASGELANYNTPQETTEKQVIGANCCFIFLS
jgi:hypothetical protein